MTNFKTKLTSLILAAGMLCAMSVTASAAQISESGGSGITPVSLTTTNDGIGGEDGEVTPTTPVERRRLTRFAVDGMKLKDIAVLEGADCRRISKSILRAKEKLKQYIEKRI